MKNAPPSLLSVAPNHTPVFAVVLCAPPYTRHCKGPCAAWAEAILVAGRYQREWHKHATAPSPAACLRRESHLSTSHFQQSAAIASFHPFENDIPINGQNRRKTHFRTSALVRKRRSCSVPRRLSKCLFQSIRSRKFLNFRASTICWWTARFSLKKQSMAGSIEEYNGALGARVQKGQVQIPVSLLYASPLSGSKHVKARCLRKFLIRTPIGLCE